MCSADWLRKPIPNPLQRPESPSYNIDMILSRTLDKSMGPTGTFEYFFLVRWEDHPPNDDTWVPRSELLRNAREMLLDFESRGELGCLLPTITGFPPVYTCRSLEHTHQRPFASCCYSPTPSSELPFTILNLRKRVTDDLYLVRYGHATNKQRASPHCHKVWLTEDEMKRYNKSRTIARAIKLIREQTRLSITKVPAGRRNVRRDSTSEWEESEETEVPEDVPEAQLGEQSERCSMRSLLTRPDVLITNERTRNRKSSSVTKRREYLVEWRTESGAVQEEWIDQSRMPKHYPSNSSQLIAEYWARQKEGKDGIKEAVKELGRWRQWSGGSPEAHVDQPSQLPTTMKASARRILSRTDCSCSSWGCRADTRECIALLCYGRWGS